jgi:hypothetical protein
LSHAISPFDDQKLNFWRTTLSISDSRSLVRGATPRHEKGLLAKSLSMSRLLKSLLRQKTQQCFVELVGVCPDDRVRAVFYDRKAGALDQLGRTCSPALIGRMRSASA